MRFLEQLRLVQNKNKHKPLHSILRLLFHGTSNTPPEVIALGNEGLDVKYAKSSGAYGAGIYFADNAAYSQSYAHRNSNGTCQLLLSFVLVGDAVPAQKTDSSLREPPLRSDG